MTVLFSDNFASGTFNAYLMDGGLVVGNPTCVTTPTNNNSAYAGKLDCTTVQQYCRAFLGHNFTALNMRAYVRFPTLTKPTVGNNIEIMQFRIQPAGAFLVGYVKNVGGVMHWMVRTSGGVDVVATTGPVVDKWYCMEIEFRQNGLCGLYIDDVLVASFTDSGSRYVDGGSSYLGGSVATAMNVVYYNNVEIADQHIGLLTIQKTETQESLSISLTCGDGARLRVLRRTTVLAPLVIG